MVDGKISFVMPDKDVTIEVALQGLDVTKEIVEINGDTNINASVVCEAITAGVGQTITFTVDHDANEMSIESVTVNGEAVNAENGVYSYVVKATDTAVQIKAVMKYTYKQKNDGIYQERVHGKWQGLIVFLLQEELHPAAAAQRK